MMGGVLSLNVNSALGGVRRVTAGAAAFDVEVASVVSRAKPDAAKAWPTRRVWVLWIGISAFVGEVFCYGTFNSIWFIEPTIPRFAKDRAANELARICGWADPVEAGHTRRVHRPPHGVPL